jgi:very-short-patch-repair endonuclease
MSGGAVVKALDPDARPRQHRIGVRPDEFHMLPYRRLLKPLSRQLRCNLTDAEQRLWGRLRRKQVLGVQFYRQKPLAGYIADFYSSAAHLVIELDGAQHAGSSAQEYDEQRTQVLQALGLGCCVSTIGR